MVSNPLDPGAWGLIYATMSDAILATNASKCANRASMVLG